MLRFRQVLPGRTTPISRRKRVLLIRFLAWRLPGGHNPASGVNNMATATCPKRKTKIVIVPGEQPTCTGYRNEQVSRTRTGARCRRTSTLIGQKAAAPRPGGKDAGIQCMSTPGSRADPKPSLSPPLFEPMLSKREATRIMRASIRTAESWIESGLPRVPRPGSKLV